MDIHTQQSISGFIASDPQLSYNANGQARFYARFGQEHFERNQDGTFTQLDPTFHDLVAFRKTAERAHLQFVKGDKFVAEGYVRDYNRTEADGEQVKAEEFVAKKLGHDLARTSYEVDRARRTPAAPTQEAAEQVPVGFATRRDAASAAPALGL